MSAANLIGNNDYATALDSHKGFSFLSRSDVVGQCFTVPVDAVAPFTASNALSIPYLTNADIIHVTYQSGGTAAGPIAFTITGAGTATASVTMTAGVVAGAPAVYNVLIAQGPNAN